MSFSKFLEVVSGSTGVSCSGCPLDRTQFVPSRLVPDSDIAFIGEAPGRNEVTIGEPFVGKSGQLLRRAVREEGFDPDLCSMANVLSCHPPRNELPDISVVKKCGKQHLYPQLLASRPKLVVLLGKTAYGYFFDMKTWGKWLHNFRRKGEFVFLMLRHPAAVLRQYNLGQAEGDKEYSLFRRDLVKARRFLDGTLYADRTYTQVKTVEEAKYWADYFCSQPMVAADIEGIPLRSWHPNAQFLSIAFSCEDKTGVCFPVDHREIEDERFKAAVREAVDRILRTDSIKIWHNAKFDTSWLRESGWTINGRQVCTMVMAYLSDENRGKGQYGLKQLSAVELEGYNDIVEGDEFAGIDLERLAYYNCEDVDNTWRLFHILKARMDQGLWWVHNKLMIPGGEALAEAERVGVYWDLRANGKLRDSLKAEIDKLVREADRKLPAGLTVTSADDLRMYLYELHDYPVISRTKKDAPQVNEYVLTVLAENHNCKIAKKVIDIRKRSKKVDTYLNGFPKFVDFDGRIHTNFWLTNTTTGRTAAEKPGMQQIPRDVSIRELIAAEEGFELLHGDLSNAEMRVAASLSEDPVLCEAFRRDADIHRLTAAQVNNITEDQVDDDLRQKAKPVNFGFLYGQQVDGFIKYAKGNYGIDFVYEEAEEIRDRYFEAYAGLPPWYTEVIEELYVSEMIRTVFGRARRFPGIANMELGDQEHCQRQAINCKVQSVSADLMLLTFIHVQRYLQRRKMRTRAILTVHDSLLAEGPPEEIPEVAAVACDYVDSFDYDWLKVPMRMDFEVGPCWNKKKMRKMKKGEDF